MKLRHKRLAILAGVLAGLVVASALILNAFRDTMVFFVTPSEVMEKSQMPERKFRIGGLVAEDSVLHDPVSTKVRFEVTDHVENVTVTYTGILPDLFREGQGVVAEGHIEPDGVFRADRVLARHDEEYMPAEAQEAIERAGHPPDAEY